MRLIPEFSEQAERELDEIATFLVRNAPRFAMDFADAFDAAILRLSDFPESGIAVADDQRLTWIAATGYVVIYSVHENRLVIVSVKHSSRRSDD